MKRLTLRRINNVLTAVVFLLCLYLVATPFLPKATYVFKPEPPLAKKHAKPPQENMLVIPAIKLQEKIYDSLDPLTLNQGIWHPRQSSTPNYGSNTVLTGHRFTYNGPAVLYNLDKVNVGDQIIVYWDHKKYDYKVHTIKTVLPSDSEVLDQTDEAILTIYTCTPLVTATHRLIIQAKPAKGDSQQ